jgi:hypothetical protein
MPDLKALERKLREVRKEVENLTVLTLDPSHPPAKRALLKELELSARAEVKLRRKALDHAQKSSKPPNG